MRSVLGFILVSVCVSAGPAVFAKSGAKKAKGHCEKLVDGETVDLAEAKDRKSCKKQGGKWSRKAHDHAGHDHEEDKHHEGDGHDHGD